MSRKARVKIEPKLVTIPGRRKWYIRWTPLGNRTPKITSTGIEIGDDDTQPPEAIEFLRNFREQLNAPPPDPYIGELLDAYIEIKRTKKVMDLPRLQSAVKALKITFEFVRPDGITEYLIGIHSDRLSVKGTPIAPDTARKEIQTLVAALNVAVKKRWIASFPEIELPEESEPREHFLSKEEFGRLVGATKSAHIRLYMLIAGASGARKKSILELKWDRVDFETRVIDFRVPGRRKTKKKRVAVPIGRGLSAELQIAKDFAETDYVIEYHGSNVQDVKKGFGLAAEAAGVTATPHTLKHTAISWLSALDYSIQKISDLTGTSTKTIERIYRKVNPEYMRDAADDLDAIINSNSVISRVQLKNKQAK